MNRELILESNSEIFTIVSVSAEKEDEDTIVFEAENELGFTIKLKLDAVSANGFRIAIGSLQDVPPLVLPKNILGEYQCHYLEILYKEEGETVFEKKNGHTLPYGKYIEIEDGMIAFNKDEILWVAYSTNESIICTLEEDKEYFVLELPKEILDGLRDTLDDIFPFNRFGKNNKLSYGYFHSIEEE